MPGVMNVSKGDHETIKDLELFADIGLAIRLGASGPHRQAFGSYILEDGVAECCSSLQLVVNATKLRSVFNKDPFKMSGVELICFFVGQRLEAGIAPSRQG